MIIIPALQEAEAGESAWATWQHPVTKLKSKGRGGSSVVKQVQGPGVQSPVPQRQQTKQKTPPCSLHPIIQISKNQLCICNLKAKTNGSTLTQRKESWIIRELRLFLFAHTFLYSLKFSTPVHLIIWVWISCCPTVHLKCQLPPQGPSSLSPQYQSFPSPVFSHYFPQYYNAVCKYWLLIIIIYISNFPHSIRNTSKGPRYSYTKLSAHLE